ncbi:MAG: DUF2335 domain-containing protein [Alphaproteobacteria bacterium]|nr:MAG: DUF2335 domain-containing protein [Alphaproteobacteria bacterium]
MTDDQNKPIESALPNLSTEDLEKIPEEIREKVLVGAQQSIELIRSPLLPPEVLIRYNNAVPGLAAKLIEWTEAEQAHRRELEIRGFQEAERLRSRAQWGGWVVSTFGLTVAGTVASVSAVYGSVAAATAAGVIAIVSVGGPFAARLLASRWQKESDERE